MTNTPSQNPSPEDDTKEIPVSDTTKTGKDENPLNTINAMVEGQTFDLDTLMGGDPVWRRDIGKEVYTIPVLSTEVGQAQMQREFEMLQPEGLPFVLHYRADALPELERKKTKCDSVIKKNGSDLVIARCLIMLIDELMQKEAVFRDIGRVEMQAAYRKKYPDGPLLTDGIYYLAFRELCKEKYADMVRAKPLKDERNDEGY